ncbi:MAG: FxsA family protein [Gammaproteobacteria bacterium]|nr:FxsA family protein [Gammaproteobacteria bacterium]
MFPVLTLIFLVVPVIEIFLLIQVGEVIGAWWTVSLVILTAVIGVNLLRYQGISTLMRAQKKLQSGKMPAQEMLEGIGLVVAGAFLLTPGFFTDGIGFCLLMPPIRRMLVAGIVSKMAVSGRFVHTHGSAASRSPHESDVIDGVNYKRDE